MPNEKKIITYDAFILFTRTKKKGKKVTKKFANPIKKQRGLIAQTILQAMP